MFKELVELKERGGVEYFILDDGQLAGLYPAKSRSRPPGYKRPEYTSIWYAHVS